MNEYAKRLMRDTVRDLVVEVRCCRKWNQTEGTWAEYYDKQIRSIRLIWANRHSGHVNRYGWPIS